MSEDPSLELELQPSPQAPTARDPFGEGGPAARARRSRNIALALGLVAFVILVFIVTVVRLGGNAVHR